MESLLKDRSKSENQAMSNLVTTFLTQFEGVLINFFNIL